MKRKAIIIYCQGPCLLPLIHVPFKDTCHAFFLYSCLFLTHLWSTYAATAGDDIVSFCFTFEIP